MYNRHVYNRHLYNRHYTISAVYLYTSCSGILFSNPLLCAFCARKTEFMKEQAICLLLCQFGWTYYWLIIDHNCNSYLINGIQLKYIDMQVLSSWYNHVKPLSSARLPYINHSASLRNLWAYTALSFASVVYYLVIHWASWFNIILSLIVILYFLTLVLL